MRLYMGSVAGLAALMLSACSGQATGDTTTPTGVPTALAERAQIIAEAVVVPQQSVALSWASAGIIAEVLAREGATVSAGDPLARLDTRELELRVEQARAGLAVAQANRDELLEGASSDEIAASQAQLAQSEAELRRARGSVTAQDVAAARARVEEARTKLAQLQAGPQSNELQQAESAVAQAEGELQSQRNTLSASKTSAALALEEAVAALTQAQVAYATAKKNWDYVQETGRYPASSSTINPATGSTTRIDDVARQQYYDAFVQAEASLRSAEATVSQAQVEYDAARQAEVTGVQAAEQQLADAQRDLAEVRAGAEPADLAAARAALASAQADLDKLLGDERNGSVEAAQAGVAQAQAQLEQIQAAPRSSALARATAQVREAELSLQQAQLVLERATLITPIDGTLVQLSPKVGETAVQTGTAALVADIATWRIETSDLTELQVVQLAVGDPAVVTFNAIPDLELSGSVTEIQLIGQNREGDITYKVVVVPEQRDPRLRWNMTAVVTITPES